MPNIQSAKKKVRQDKKRTARNEKQRHGLKTVLKTFRAVTKKGSAHLSKAYALIDKAVKKKLIHKNKAARLKSRISRSSKKKK